MAHTQSIQKQKKYCVVFLQMGGPKNKREIKEFLENLFSDPEIIQLPTVMRPFQKIIAKIITKSRIKGTIEMYEQIGGKSPILEITNSFAKQVKEQLISKGYNAETFVIMRYTKPRAKETIKEIQNSDCDEIILFTLYPHYSNATTGSSIKDFYKHKNGKINSVEIKEIKEWGLESTYIDWWIKNINEVLQEIPSEEIKQTHILFSAHSLPKKYVEQGDPYLEQLNQSYQIIINEIKKKYPQIKTTLTFQSKVGPVEWLQPYTEEKIREIGQKKTKHLIIVPFGFVSDHLETVYEIDIYYRKIAEQSKIPFFYRIKTPNDDPEFASGIANIIEKKVMANE